MDFQNVPSTTILNNHDLPILQGHMAKEQAPEVTLKIGHFIANIFIEIANFFLRLFNYEPYSLYSAEKILDRVKVETKGFGHNEQSNNLLQEKIKSVDQSFSDSFVKESLEENEIKSITVTEDSSRLQKEILLNTLIQNCDSVRTFENDSEKLFSLAKMAFAIAKLDSSRAEKLVEEVISLLDNPELSFARFASLLVILRTLPLLDASTFERYTELAITWPSLVKKKNRFEIQMALMDALATLNPQKIEEIADQIFIDEGKTYSAFFRYCDVANALAKLHPQKAEDILINSFEMIYALPYALVGRETCSIIKTVTKILKKLGPELL